MAGASKAEFKPLLPPGLHPHDLDGLRRLCVDRFPESITRPRIMQKLSDLVSLINRTSIPAKVWVDGSFLTEKLNPDDVDIVLVVDKLALLGCSDEARQFVEWFRNTRLYELYRCDNYFFVVDDSDPRSEYVYAYWLRQFGFSRGVEMKGLAVVSCPYVVMP